MYAPGQPSKIDKVNPAVAGHLPLLLSNGTLEDSGYSPDDLIGAGSGLASASGTAPLTLTLNANALTGSVAAADATHAGSMSAAHYTLVNNATTAATINTIVKRDGSGNVTAAGFVGIGTNLTALNASNLSSGTVAAARLGTGTANSSTFLHGDNSWSVLQASDIPDISAVYARQTDLSSYALTTSLSSYALTTSLSVYLTTMDAASTYATLSSVSTISNDLSTLTGTVSGYGTSISSLQSDLTTLSGSVSTLSTTVDGKADEASPTLSGTITLNGEAISAWPREKIGVEFGDGATVVEADTSGPIVIPYGCTVEAIYILTSDSDTLTINVQSSDYSTYGTWPSISGGAITLSASNKYHDATLSGWTTSLSAGDLVRFELGGSPAAAKRVTVTLVLRGV